MQTPEPDPSAVDIVLQQAGPISVAVVTALLTTIVVEYLAKPRLESRKARLIRDRQQIDEVVFAFQKAGLALGAVMPGDDLPEESLERRIHQKQVIDLGDDLRTLIDALSRLPGRYVRTHREHIAWTARYLGYAQALASLAGDGHYVDDATLRQVADDMPAFDTYFVANADFHDSQEPLIKRWVWKHFTAKSYRETARATMEARYGGFDTPEQSG